MRTFFDLQDLKREYARIQTSEVPFDIGSWTYFDAHKDWLATDEGLFALFVHVFLDRGEKAEKVAEAIGDAIQRGLLDPTTLHRKRKELEKVLADHSISWNWPGKAPTHPGDIVDDLLACADRIRERWGGLFSLYQHIINSVSGESADPDARAFLALKWYTLEIAMLPMIGQKLATFFVLTGIDYGVFEFLGRNPRYLEVAMDVHLNDYFREFFSYRGKRVGAGALPWYAQLGAAFMSAANGISPVDLDYAIWCHQRRRA